MWDSWNFDGRKVLFIEMTMLGRIPSESHLMVTDDPVDKFEFFQPEPASQIEIKSVHMLLSKVDTWNKVRWVSW